MSVALVDRTIEDPTDADMQDYRRRWMDWAREGVLAQLRLQPLPPSSIAHLTLRVCVGNVEGPVRSVRGDLVVCDLFESEKYRRSYRLDSPGRDSTQWTQALPLRDNWVSKAPLDELRIRFDVEAIVLADGGVVRPPKR